MKKSGFKPRPLEVPDPRRALRRVETAVDTVRVDAAAIKTMSDRVDRVVAALVPAIQRLETKIDRLIASHTANLP